MVVPSFPSRNLPLCLLSRPLSQQRKVTPLYQRDQYVTPGFGNPQPFGSILIRSILLAVSFRPLHSSHSTVGDCVVTPPVLMPTLPDGRRAPDPWVLARVDVVEHCWTLLLLSLPEVSDPSQHDLRRSHRHGQHHHRL